MAANTDELIEKLTDKYAGYDYVKCTLSDLAGSARGKMYPVRKAADVMKHGMPIYSGIIGMQGTAVVVFPEVAQINYDNSLWFPDPHTLHAAPWSSKDGGPKIAEVYGSMVWAEGMIPQEACPRNAAKRQLKRLAERGYQLRSGFEMEFLLHHKDTNTPVTKAPYFCYQRHLMESSECLIELDQHMQRAGVDIGVIHTEYSAGQYEFPLEPTTGIKSADDVFLIKSALHEISKKHEMYPSYVTKSNAGGASSGLHYNFSIWDQKTHNNLFYDEAAEDGLSLMAKCWVAGLLKHADSLVALCCPTVNCYRRLHTPWAPDFKDWGVGNRMATIRTKQGDEEGTYIENRIPGMLANPYLVLAATIAAGLDGVDSNLECPPQNQKDSTRLPDSLTEALYALAQNVTFKEAVGPQLISWFIQMKKEVDLTKFPDHNPSNNCVDDITEEFNEYVNYV